MSPANERLSGIDEESKEVCVERKMQNGQIGFRPIQFVLPLFLML